LLAAANADGVLQLWDLNSLQPMGTPLKGHTAAVHLLKFNRRQESAPDGTPAEWTSDRLLSADQSGGLWLWSWDGGEPKGTALRGHEGQVVSVDFKPDSQLAASGDANGVLRLWDARSGKPYGEPMLGHKNNINAVAFSPVAPILASVGWDARLYLWDVNTQTRIGAPLGGEGGAGMDLAFSPDGGLVAVAGEDTNVVLWDVENHKRYEEPLRGHNKEVMVVRFSPDGSTLASGSDDGAVRLWDVESARPLGRALIARDHASPVEQLAFTADNHLLATHDDGVLDSWNLDFVAVACTVAGRNLTHAEWSQFMEDWLPYETTCPEWPLPKE